MIEYYSGGKSTDMQETTLQTYPIYNTHMEKCTDFFQMDTQRFNNMSNVLENFSRCKQIQMRVTNACNNVEMITKQIIFQCCLS